MKQSINRYLGLLFLSVFVLGIASSEAISSENDPLEPFNRAMFGFNEVIDDIVLEPVAEGYKTVTPDPIEIGVSNFFNNLGEINTIFNDVLQLKLGDAVSASSRLVINSTFGIFGFFDVATSIGIERHKEDFGQTLGYYGISS